MTVLLSFLKAVNFREILNIDQHQSVFRTFKFSQTY